MRDFNQDKDNCDGLTQLGIALGAHPRLESLAEYCRCRERGLRRKAFTALESFLKAAADWDVEAARLGCRLGER